MTKEIEFVALSEYHYEVAPRPVPTSQYLPSWWKNADPYARMPENPDGKKIVIRGQESNATFKKCTPMLDLLTSGYIVPLWAGVTVENIEGNLSINWRVNKQVFDLHGSQDIDIPDGYSLQQFKYLNPWIPQLPKGYSLLVIPPVGYPNSPFRCMSAIIDYDSTKHPLSPPVFVKEGFEGVVEQGTPMMQLIPFKRDDWESSFSFLKEGELTTIIDKYVKGTLVNNYVKKFWTKKHFK